MPPVPNDVSESRFAAIGRRIDGMSTSRVTLIAALAGLVAVVAAILTPLLPVTQHTAAVQWPQGQSLSAESASVTASLVQQTPEKLDVTVPCSVLAATDATKTTVVLATMTGQAAPFRALYITTNATTTTVMARGEKLVTQPRTLLANCGALRVWSSASGVSAQFTKLTAVTQLDASYQPQVNGIYTQLPTATVQAATAQGLAVTATIDTRFDSSMTWLKAFVIAIAAIAAVLAVAALAVLDYRHGYHRLSAPGSRWQALLRALKPSVADGLVVAILIIWHFLGAGVTDDGYILNMGRAAADSGYLANYYRWYGTPEAPFDWYYAFLAEWGKVSHTMLWMHLPGLLAGIASWLMLSRVLIPRLGSVLRTGRTATLAAGAVFVAFWLPLNSGLRTEPIIVLGSLITWYFVEHAIATKRLTSAAFAAFAATLTFALAPHGMIALAMLLVGARGLLHIILARRGRGFVGLAAVVLPLAGAGLSVLLIVFRDQTLAGVWESVRVKYAVGPTLDWFQEYLRYYFMTNDVPDASLTRRVPVYLVVACLAITLAFLLRRKGIRGVDSGAAWRLVGATLVTALLLTLTPTKWTTQFGIYAGFGAALAALATFVITELGARSVRNLFVFVSGLLFACALAAAGRNAWPWTAELGISFYDKAPIYGGVSVSTAILVLAVIAGVLAVWQHLRVDYVRDAGLVHDDADNTPASRRQRFVLTAASWPIVLVAGITVIATLGLFVKAYADRAPGYTVLGGNLDALKGNTCGMADQVLVENDPNQSMLRPVGNQSATQALTGNDPSNVGFTPNGVALDLTPNTSALDPGQTLISGILSQTFVLSGGPAGLLGGIGPVGVNGSKALLPYGLDPARTPVMGSYGYSAGDASLTTGWYQLPDRSAPLIVISAAGSIYSVDNEGVVHPGQSVTVQFGRQDGGTFTPVGAPYTPIIAGPDSLIGPWQNLRIPMTAVPGDATAMRIVATDKNLNPIEWLALTPPRAPKLQTLGSLVGQDPTLIDFVAGAQFPCQHPMADRHGVYEVPKWRILPDNVSALSQSKSWMGINGGGPLDPYFFLVNPNTVATYLSDDWYTDWGSLERLTPVNPTAKPAHLTLGTATHWGLDSPGDIRVVKQSKSGA